MAPSPSLGLDGSYAVSCYAVLDGSTPVSARSYVGIDGVNVTSTDYYFQGTSCSGSAFASVAYLTARLSARGTTVVAGPNGGSVTALNVLVSTYGEPVRASGSVRLSLSGAPYEVLHPGGSVVLQAYSATQDNADTPDILAVVGSSLYFGDDDAPLDVEGYPLALDYSFGWLMR